MQNTDLHIKVLNENLLHLNKALTAFEKSLNKCKNIGIKASYNFEELESFDSMTVKFARISDILTQKILRTLFILLRETNLTFLDMCIKAEKLGIVEKSEILIYLRDLRNQIAHEYDDENLITLYSEIFSTAHQLQNVVYSVTEIAKRYNFIQ